MTNIDPAIVEVVKALDDHRAARATMVEGRVRWVCEGCGQPLEPSDPMAAFEDQRRHQADTLRPLIAAAVDAARAKGYEQARKVVTDYFADMGAVWGGSRSWLTTGDHVAELVQDCLREAFEEATQ